MKKFILISFSIHCLLFLTIAFYNNSKEEELKINNNEKILLKNDKDFNKKINKNETYKKNIQKEDIMNAIAISEEELKLEINRIQSLEENKIKYNKQKQFILEENIRIEKEKIKEEKNKLENDKKNSLSLIKKKEENLIEKIKEIKEIQKQVKKDKQILSKEKNNNFQQSKEIEFKKEENTKILEKIKEKEKIEALSSKEKLINLKKQSEYIKKQEEEIKKLKNKLIEKSAITNKKEKNSFLDKLPLAEQIEIKRQMREYNTLVKNKIMNIWVLPKNTTKEDCIIDLMQSNEGNIIAIKLIKCNNNEIFKDSITKAIWDSSPLPLPKNKMIFDKHIKLYFAVD